jgi:hypothetical protein
MVTLNLDSTVKRIFQAWASRQEGEHDPWARYGWREHLGGSRIGASCERAIWYSYRWAKPVEHSGRIKRLFDTGHREEDRLVADLETIGCEVFAVDPVTRKQFRVASHGGHFGGSLDGLVLGIIEAPKSWHLCEFKTHNRKSFDDLKKNKVRASKPAHYAQMQVYMGLWNEQVASIKKRLAEGVELVALSELAAIKIGKVDRAFYLARCKDDDDLYQERIDFDRATFEHYKARALRIIQATDAPDRISERPDWYECKWCDFYAVCHATPDAHFPAVHCRTCADSVPELVGDRGLWRCVRHGRHLSPTEQFDGCQDHIFAPSMMPFHVAAVDEYRDRPNWVSYDMPRGRRLINATVEGKVEIDRYMAVAYFEQDDAAYQSLVDLQVCATSRELALMPLTEVVDARG